jgi:hypothetical protein
MHDIGMRAALAVAIVVGIVAMPADARSSRSGAGERTVGAVVFGLR